MTTVVIYDEAKAPYVRLAGGGRDDQTLDILAGAQRMIVLEPGQTVTIGGDSPDAAKEEQRGPTISEFVAAGYDAKDYPPAGYEAVSSKDEIDAAIGAQGKRTAPTGLNAEQVPGTFTPVPGSEPWDVTAEPLVPPPQKSMAQDPRNDEQKAKDAERAEVEKNQVAAASAPFPTAEPTPIAPIPKEDRGAPEEPTDHTLLPGQPSTEPVPGIAKLNEAEQRIPEPIPEPIPEH